ARPRRPFRNSSRNPKAPAHWHAAPIDAPPIHPAPGRSGRRGQWETKSRRKSCPMTNPQIAPWQAVFRTIDESGYTVDASSEPSIASDLPIGDCRYPRRGASNMSLWTIILIILVIALLGGFSGIGGGPFYGTGYYGGGGLGLVIVVLLILLLLGKL